MNTHIFRKYDIRGEVPRDLTPELVICPGRAPGTFFIRNGDCRVCIVWLI